MGGREVGGMATLLSGHRDPTSSTDREEMARFWDIPSLPNVPGKTAVEMFDAMRDGRIKAVWIACTNPAQSMPDQAKVEQALREVEFVVVQDAFQNTETTAFADLLLPATSWGEKEGTVTNSERRISRVRAAVAGPGEARHDWAIAVDFAHRLGDKLGYDTKKLFPYERPEEIFNEHRATTRGRDLDITGLSYALLESSGPQQWPYPERAIAGKARLYEDGVFATPNGRARFVAAPCRPLFEATDARFPLHLTTGRVRDQWHGMSRTGTVARSFNDVEEPLLTLNPEDMQRRGLSDGDLVRLSSRRGELSLRVHSGDDVRPAQAWLPMHWGACFMNGGGSNALMPSAFDPQSKQPELKHAAVRVEKLDYGWQVVAMRSGDALRYLDRVRPLLREFPYASCGLYGRDVPVIVFRAAAPVPVGDEVIARLDAALAFDDQTQTMDYRDARKGVSKRALVADGVLIGVRLTGETAARDWLKEMIASSAPAADVRRWILAPVSKPLAGQVARGRVLCNCLDVPETQIRARFAAGATLDQVQTELKCGTSCGSCLPELRRIAAQSLSATVATEVTV